MDIEVLEEEAMPGEGRECGEGGEATVPEESGEAELAKSEKLDILAKNPSRSKL